VSQKITLSVFFLKNKNINGQFLSHENVDNFFFCVSTFWDVWILHFIKTKPENVILKKFLNLFSINLFITNYLEGSSRSWSNGNWIYNYLCNQCPSPIKWRVRIPLMARCTRYNILYDKVSQWLAAGWWFPPSIKLTTNDIAEILLKVVLNTKPSLFDFIPFLHFLFVFILFEIFHWMVAIIYHIYNML
jgi:hypothetical protein